MHYFCDTICSVSYIHAYNTRVHTAWLNSCWYLYVRGCGLGGGEEGHLSSDGAIKY